MALLIGKRAPDFVAKAVVKGAIEEFSLSKWHGQKVVLFFYPADFTFVCPTELHALQDRLSEFEKRDTQVVGCSVDSCFSHLAWLATPKVRGGIEGISYPLISDLTKSVARSFDVLKEDEGVAYRALFILDAQGIIRHQLINDLSLGRSVDEVLRILDALSFQEQYGEVCPANWKPGQNLMKATLEGVRDYFTSEK